MYLNLIKDKENNRYYTFLLTMAGANCKANAFLFTVKDHIEAFHDDSPHHRTSAGLGHSKLIAVFMSRGHILYRPQILLQRHQKKG